MQQRSLADVAAASGPDPAASKNLLSAAAAAMAHVGARAAGADAGNAPDMAALKALADKHNIRHDYILRVRQLRHFKVVLLCDDSSSMGSIVEPGPGAPPADPFAESVPTRWSELRSTCELVVELAATVTGGIDVHFLNHRGALKDIRSKAQLLAGFPREPHGRTPLTRAFNDVLAANRDLPGEGRLLVLIATDGEPDGGAQGIAEFRAALEAKPLNCKVQVLKISDDDGATAYLDELDGAIAGLDVTDDYWSVLDRVKRFRGPETPFSFGDYLIKCLVGPFDDAMDGIDEPKGEISKIDEPEDSAAKAVAAAAAGGGAVAVPMAAQAKIADLEAKLNASAAAEAAAKHAAEIAKEQAAAAADQRLCLVCQDKPKEVALQPCQHL